MIWNAHGVPQQYNAAHPKHQEEEETSPNKNTYSCTYKYTITDKLALSSPTEVISVFTMLSCWISSSNANRLSLPLIWYSDTDFFSSRLFNA